MPDYRAAVQQLADEERSRLRANVFTAAEANPDQAARAKVLGERVGVPQEVAERNLNDIERRVLTGEIEQATTDTPAARQFYGTPYGAKVGKDDVEVLTEMERTFQRGLKTGQAVQGKIGETVRGATPPVERSVISKVIGAAEGGALRASAGVVGVAQAPVDLLAPLLDPLAGTILPENPLRRVASGLSSYRQGIEDQSKAAMPKGDGNIESGIYAGISSLATNLLALPLAFTPGGQGAALTAMTLPVGGQAYGEAHDKGLAPVPALTFGASQAAIEYATEKIPLQRLIGDVAANAGFVRTLAKQVALEVPGEQVATILQDLNEWAVLNPEKPFRAYLEERPSAAAQTLVATIVGVGGQVSVAKGIDTVLDAATRRELQAQFAEDRTNFIAEVNKLAAASKVAQRDAASFEQFVAQAAQDGPVQEVYLDAQVLNQLGLAEKLAEVSPAVAEQIATALATGGDVVIPVAEYAARIAPTDLAQGLLDHLRTAPDELSRAEAQEFLQSAPEQFQQELERVTSQAASAVAAQLSADNVKQNLLDQLNTANRFTKDVNEAYASLAASFYATTAARFGITPEEMYQRYPLQVRGAKPEGESVGQAPTGEQQYQTEHTMPDGRKAVVRLQQQMLGMGADRALSVRVIAIDPTVNKPFGYVDFEMQGNTLRAANVAVADGVRRQGIAEAMYRAAREAGYDIAPGRAQTPAGEALVAKLRERGVINKEVGADGEVLNQAIKDSDVKLPKKANATTAVDLRTGPRLTGKQAMDIHGVAAFFDAITGRRDFNDPKEQKRAIKQIVAELKFQLQQEKNGLDWYEGDVKTAFETTQQFIPELADPTKRQLFSVIAGLQSPGTNARDNWVIAAEAFKHYVATGTIPGRNPVNGQLWAGGPVSVNKEKSLNFLNAMVQDLGEQATVEWLMSTHTVKELNEARAKWGGMGPGVSGKATDQLMGLFAFGPKVGPFVMNINGIHELTIDVWATRSFNRYFGQMLGADGKIIDAPTEPQRRVAKELFNAAAEQVGIKPYQVQSVLWFFEQQLFTHLGAGSPSYGFSDGARRFADRQGDPGAGGVLNQAGRDAQATEGGINGRPEQAGDGGGGYSAGGLAPLPGAPSVAGASGPDPRLVAVAEQYARSIGVDLRRPAEYVQVDPERAARIAAAYEAMPHAPQDPAVQEAYQNLIAQTVAQYRALEAAGYKFYLFDEGNDPYAGNPWNAMRDLRANQTMGVFATEAGFGSGATDLDVSNNPLMADTGIQWPYGGPDGPMKRVLANDLFRAVHDAFGHGLEGAGFRAQGEENAWQAHVRLFTGSAVGAITSETRGQNSWLNYGPFGERNRNAKVEDTVFADQKTGLMPEWTWTEGRAPDMDDGTQAEQRRLRQTLDLDILQRGDSDTLEQAPRVEQTETPSFTAWFGDSKVVDEQGRPLVVYHGGPKGITAFDPARIGSNFGFDRDGFFFTTDSSNIPGGAANYAGEGGQVYPVYLSLQRPYTIAQFAADLNLQVSDLVMQQGSPQSPIVVFDTDRAEIIQRAREGGHDGVAFEVDYGDGTNEGLFIAFEPTQIKSATGNRGTFDPNDPNILNQEAKPGEVAVTGLHFSRQSRTALNGAFYGTGLQGAERDRVFNSDDRRLRTRVYFYVDEGTGVVPEAGVGGYAHSAELPNLYDINADPLKLARQGGGINAIETRILDAGFDGYYRAKFANNAGVAVVIGPAAANIPVARVDNPVIGAGGYVAPEPTVRVQLSPEQMAGLDNAALRAVAPNAVVERSFIAVRPSFVTLRESELDAARPLMSSLGVTLPAPAAPLAQNEGARGTFSPSTLTITLLEKADLSTFLHETGHFFLEALADMAAQPGAPTDITSDMGKVLEWFGVKDLETWRSMSLNQQRKYHEKFAESFEQYLFEGKAPSKDLQPLFSRFRAWLTSVYRSLQAFMGNYNTQLSDEVRSVFDRLLATQDQITELESTRGFTPLFASAAEAGMTPEEWAKYQGTNAEATEDAIAALQARSLRDLRWVVNARSRELKRISKDVAEKRKAVEAEVRAEVQSEPVFAVQRWLKTGVMPDGTKTVGAKLNTAALREMYGDGPAAPWRYLATNMITAEDGLHPDVVAEMFGFTSGDEMVRAIVAAFPEDSEIQGRTDQRMLERYGDLTTPAGQARAAEEAVHNEARARMVATELSALAKATTPARKMMAAAKQFAKTLVARRKVKDLKPAQHTAAETRAAKRAAEASAAGKTQDAITAKRDQLLNFYAARETVSAQEEVDKGLKYLAKVSESSTLSPDYKEQIDALLERFDLRRGTSNRALEKRQALLEWAESQREMGVEPNIPPELLNEAMRKSYKDMTVEEFRGLIDTVKQIEHLGRLKQKLLTAKDQREFDAVRDLMATSILENAGEREADTRTPNTVLGGALLGMKKFWAAHIKAATWARVMDGGKDGGPVWEYLIRAANAAGDMEIERRAKATVEITELLAPVMKLGPMGGKGIFIPAIGRSMNREARLAVALNTGNASNMQRLMGGEGWTAEQVQAITASLTEAEWRFVQKVWDYFESFRPEIGAKEKRVTGVEPNWIEATPLQVETADGKVINLRGGYYPVKYDPRASERAEAHDEAETAKQMMRGAYTSATTRRSFTKDRADEVNGRPLLYSLDGIYNGVNEVIHDLAWHEFLIDANRLIRDPKIAAAMRQKYGPEAHQQFKTWLQDTAVGDRPMQNAGEAAAAWVRQGVSVAGLGFNIMSALIQPLGITQSIVRVGPQYIGRGISQFIAGPFSAVEMVHGKSSFMANRAKTRYRELAEVRAQVKGQTKARRAIDGAAYFLMLRAQQTVDIPTWIGAYEKAIGEGNNEERAIALADQAVIDAQGGGTMKDLSAIERGGPVQKLFTVFYSFFNAALNMGAVQTMTAKSKPKLAADYLLLYVLPVVLGAFLKDALTPGDSGDDEPEELMGKLIAEQISYLTGLMFGVREIGPAIQTVAGVNQYPMGYSGPAGLRPINDLYKLAQQVNQGEADEGLRKAIVNTAGSLLRLPAAQINRSITGVEALADGKTDNPAAVIFGYQEPN